MHANDVFCFFTCPVDVHQPVGRTFVGEERHSHGVVGREYLTTSNMRRANLAGCFYRDASCREGGRVPFPFFFRNHLRTVGANRKSHTQCGAIRRSNLPTSVGFFEASVAPLDGYRS